jgi:cytochrome c
MRSFIPVLVALTWLAACGPSALQREQAQKDSAHAAAVDSVTMAAARFDTTVFDTIKWKKKGDDVDRGSIVYQYSCVKCHGHDGGGVQSVVFRGDTLNPPSFLAPDWPLATDAMGLRKAVFTGNVAGMPHFGVIGLAYRDVDAVSAYINKVLRANVAKARVTK